MKPYVDDVEIYSLTGLTIYMAKRWSDPGASLPAEIRLITHRANHHRRNE